MAEQKTIVKMEDVLFKPLIYINEQKQAKELIIIFNLLKTESTSVSPESKQQTEVIYIGQSVNVGDSIEESSLSFENIVINSDFLSKVSYLETEEVLNEIALIGSLVSSDLAYMNNRMDSLNKTIYCLNSLVNQKQVNEADNIKSLFKFSIKNILKKSPLNEKEIEHVMQGVGEIISQNLEIDVDDKDEMQKLKDAIEVQIINKLPSSVSADDINIDIEEIKSVISQFNKQQKEGEENGQ